MILSPSVIQLKESAHDKAMPRRPTVPAPIPAAKSLGFLTLAERMRKLGVTKSNFVKPSAANKLPPFVAEPNAKQKLVLKEPVPASPEAPAAKPALTPAPPTAKEMLVLSKSPAEKVKVAKVKAHLEKVSEPSVIIPPKAEAKPVSTPRPAETVKLAELKVHLEKVPKAEVSATPKAKAESLEGHIEKVEVTEVKAHVGSVLEPKVTIPPTTRALIEQNADLFSPLGRLNVEVFKRVWLASPVTKRGRAEVEFNRHFPKFIEFMERLTGCEFAEIYSRMGAKFLDESEYHWMRHQAHTGLGAFPPEACHDRVEIMRIYKGLGQQFFDNIDVEKLPLAYRFYIAPELERQRACEAEFEGPIGKVSFDKPVRAQADQPVLKWNSVPIYDNEFTRWRKAHFGEPPPDHPFCYKNICKALLEGRRYNDEEYLRDREVYEGRIRAQGMADWSSGKRDRLRQRWRKLKDRVTLFLSRC